MAALRNILLRLAYDGTAYCGWQVQSNGPSIQAALERAIEKLTGTRSPVYSAGRTDSGVHALGQVANFHTACDIPAGNFRPALQTRLPEDIVILESREVPVKFHATYAAHSKRYRYVIDNSPVPLPFLKRYAWQLRRRLDVEAMHDAAQLLVGRHDFRSFETDWPNKVTSVRTVSELSVRRCPMWELWNSRASGQECNLAGEHSTAGKRPIEGGPGAGETALSLICLEIAADGFLYNMVRAITGTLVNVGRQKWSAHDVSRILESQRRSLAGSTAPSAGLYLVDVEYPPAAFAHTES